MKYKKIHLSKAESRVHLCTNYRGFHGKSSVIIECPFCGDRVIAFVWSLAGSGKRCTCKEVIHHTRISFRDRVPIEANK